MPFPKTFQQLHSHIAKYAHIIAGILFLILLCSAAYALYDVQTAQGVGLYLSMQFDIPYTAVMDILSTAAFMMILLLLIILPGVFLKHRSTASCLRFLSLYLAFIPAISTAYLIHLPDNSELFHLHPAFTSGPLGQVWSDAFACLAPILQIILPVLILLYGCHFALNKNTELTASTEPLLPIWHRVLILLSLFLLVTVILFPELTPVSEYTIWYLLMLICFDLWEKMIAGKPHLQSACHIITAVLIFRSIYRLLELMSHYRL